ncbi:MAG: tRNA lysidine(34) synthetase TilS [Candidatus Anammoxibacter sp.]
MDLEKNVTNFIKSRDFITDKGSVIIAVSGGADSVALTHVLCGICRKKEPGCKLYIAHLNHKLRGSESDEDSEYVKHLARQLNLPIFTEEIDITSVSKKLRLSIEEAARVERYTFLERCANEVGASHVAVAHTADDNIETLLQRIIRGTGILGLRGIVPERLISGRSNVILIRPFLDIWKKTILTYLNEKGITYRTDSSNLQTKYLRNRIRLELLPLLEAKYNNQIKHALTNLGAIFNENNKLIDELSFSLLKDATIKKETDKYTLDKQILLKSPEIIQQKVVNDIFNNLGAPLKHIGYRQYNEVLQFIKDSKDGDVLQISAHLNISGADGKLFIQISHEISQNNKSLKIKDDTYQKEFIKEFGETELAVPGVTELPLINSKIETRVVENEKGFLEKFKAGKDRNEEAFDIAKVEFPLSVRLRKRGDRFRPIGSSGTKKLKDFLIDIKVPKNERYRVPVVTSEKHPVWIVGLRIDNRVKISDTTKKIIILKYLRQP